MFVRLPDLPQRRLNVVALSRKRSKNAASHAECHDRASVRDNVFSCALKTPRARSLSREKHGDIKVRAARLSKYIRTPCFGFAASSLQNNSAAVLAFVEVSREHCLWYSVPRGLATCFQPLFVLFDIQGGIAALLRGSTARS